MNNPIGILIIWLVFNLIIGNATKKKKEAQRKARELQNRPSTGVDTAQRKQKTQEYRKTLEEFKRQLEREFRVPTEEPKKPATLRDQAICDQAAEAEEERKRLEYEEAFKPVSESEAPKTEYISPKLSFNPKEDILKAIIYREILEKPKSLARR